MNVEVNPVKCIELCKICVHFYELSYRLKSINYNQAVEISLKAEKKEVKVKNLEIFYFFVTRSMKNSEILSHKNDQKFCYSAALFTFFFVDCCDSQDIVRGFLRLLFSNLTRWKKYFFGQR